MVKRVMVRALLLAVLISMVLPFSAFAAYTRPIYVYGHVWDETNDRGVAGATVELYRDTGSGWELVSSKVTGNTNGDFGMGSTAVPGKYKLMVASVPSSIHPMSVWGGEDMWLGEMDPDVEDTWFYSWFYAGGGAEEPYNVGPINFYCANDETPPDPSSWVYIFGRVYDPAAQAAITDADDLSAGVTGVTVELQREIVKNDGNVITTVWQMVPNGSKLSDDGGFFGFGVTGIAGMYKVALIGTAYTMTDMYVYVSAPSWIPWEPMGAYNIGPLMFPAV